MLDRTTRRKIIIIIITVVVVAIVVIIAAEDSVQDAVPRRWMFFICWLNFIYFYIVFLLFYLNVQSHGSHGCSFYYHGVADTLGLGETPERLHGFKKNVPESSD